MLRFTDNDFDSDQALTIGVDFKTKIINVDGVNIKLAIWDTAGQERFRTLTPSYYRDAQGAILVYDVTKRNTFDKLDSWLQELEIYGTKPNMAKMVVGNKIDQANRELSRDDGFRFAKKHRTLFIETSAKTSEGVRDAFEEVVRKVNILTNENLDFKNHLMKTNIFSQQIIETDGLWDKRNSQGVNLSNNNESQSPCNYC